MDIHEIKKKSIKKIACLPTPANIEMFQKKKTFNFLGPKLCECAGFSEPLLLTFAVNIKS